MNLYIQSLVVSKLTSSVIIYKRLNYFAEKVGELTIEEELHAPVLITYQRIE